MSDLSVGTSVAGFRIESVIGEGSMGTVYSAKDVALDRRVAVKVLAPALARDERFRERFLRESRLAASLEHPNIVPIHAAGEADGQLYLAMRYVDGRDLASLIRSLGRLDAERAVDLVAQVGSALDAAHARGLIHRDVKPANILLARHDGKSDHAYLCDFGLAKHASTVSSLTGDRGIVGTVAYLAPEQIEGRPVDGRVDVYALGCVLYELLTGEPPFNRGNELVALLAHLNDPTPKVSVRRSDVSDAFDDVVATALAKDRDRRYATCTDLVEAARAALHGERLGAPEPPAADTAAVRTFLFADVRGYTSYTREHGDEAGADLARRFAAVVSQLAPQHRGTLQELRGDEALVVFDSARAALRFALGLQAAVVDEGLVRPVGIGLDAGEAVVVEDGFRGGALNRAARLCALAGPGDVLASDAVRELAGQTDGVVYGFRREERLKGFEKPVGVVEIHSTQAAPGRELGRSLRRTLLGTRPGRRIALAVAVLVAAGAAVGALIVRGGSSAAAVFPTDSFGIVDTATGKPAGSLNPGSSQVDGMIKSAGGFWALAESNGFFLQQINTTQHAVTQQVPLAHAPYWVAPHTAFGSVWLTWNEGDKPQLVRFDPQFGRISARITLPLLPDAASKQAEGLALTRDAVWVAYGSPKRLAKIDPGTNKITKVVSLPKADTWFDTLLAAGDGQLWAVDRTGGRQIVRLDPETGEVLASGKIHGGFVEDVAVAGGSLWLPVENDGGVWQLDKAGAIVGKVETGQVPWGFAVDGTNVYVSNQNSGTVTRIDALTRETRQFAVGHRPLGLGIDKGRLWVFLGQSADEARARITGSRVVEAVTPGDPFWSTDPANLQGIEMHQLQYAVGLRLMDLRFTSDGRPELYPSGALAQPVISNGGRTFTFTVRPGFKYSPPSNASVTATDWKFSLERALSPVYGNHDTSYCQYLISDLVGQNAYGARRAAHISGIAAAGSRITFTLTKPSSTFPARLANACFTSVPLGTPVIAGGVQLPIASAGPYYVDSHIGGQQLVLQKNPNYTGPRRRDVDAIVFRNGLDPTSAASLVAAGKADYTWVTGSSDAAPSMNPGGLYARTVGPTAGKGQRYFQIPAAGIRFLQLNTARGPLRDIRLRRAVALAVDRAGVAKVDDGTPAARMITPGVPGYTPRQTLPGPAAVARARALVGHRRVRLVLYTYTDAKNTNPDRARLIRDSLAAVGFDVAVKISVDPWGVARRGKTRVDMVLNGWIPDYVDPQGILNEVMDPASEASAFTKVSPADAGWLARLRAVSKVQGAQRAAAYQRLDRDLVLGPVPVVPISFTSGNPQLFSKRIGCQTFLPQYSGLVDLASLCLK